MWKFDLWKLFCITRAAALGLAIYSAGAFAEAPPTKPLQIVIVVNRTATPEETASGKQIVAITYQNFKAFSYGYDSGRQSRMELMQRLVNELQLQDQPFSLEYTEDLSGRSLSDITLRAGEISRTLSLETITAALPENQKTPTPPPPVSLAELQQLAAGESPDVNLARKTLWWLSTAPVADLQCAGDTPQFASRSLQRVFEAAHLAPAGAADPRAAFTWLAPILSSDQRLRIFDLQRNAAPCLRGLAKAWWEYTVAENVRTLFADFEVHLTYIDANRKRFTFNGLIESHTYADRDGDLSSRLFFLQELLLTHSSPEFMRFIAQPFRHWATLDTNTPEAASRLEPIDILTCFVSNHHFAPLKHGTTFDHVSRNALARQSIRHVLGPDFEPPAFLIAKSDAATTREDGHETYYVYCAGEKIVPPVGSKQRAAGTPLADSVAFSDEDLMLLRTQNAVVYLTCGGLQAVLSNPIEPLRIPVRDPANARFVVGEDRMVKGVATFQIVNDAGRSFIDKLKIGAVAKGYNTVEEKPAPDIRSDFLSELKDADFYFPANHSTTGTTVMIGDDGATKLRIQKTMAGGVVSEVVLFIPQGGPQREVSDTDLARLFQARRALPVQRRLHIMDLKCNSIRSVPHWMRFCKFSLQDNLAAADAPAMADKFEGEVPVAIGAARTFDPSNFSALLENSNYPFRALEIAAAQQPVGDLVAFLQQADFAPNTSIGNTVYFDTNQQTERINLVLTLSDGRRFTH